jgi:hypothetical protein
MGIKEIIILAFHLFDNSTTIMIEFKNSMQI